MKTPTASEIQNVLLKLQTADRQAYFFERLKNPAWLEPLRDARVFSRPVEPIAREGNLYFPPWPPAKYLITVAREKPEVVASIIEEMETKNPTIQADLAEAMLRLPVQLAARLARKTEAWIDQRLFSRVPMVLTTLAEHLIRNGEVRSGLRLARRIISVTSQEPTVRHPLFERSHAVSKIFDWFYDDALKKLSDALADVQPREALVMLSQVLYAALRIEDRVPKPDDFSSIWLRDLEKPPGAHDVKEILATELMRVAKNIVDRGLMTGKDVYDFLSEQRSTIFQRIALRLIVHSDDLNEAHSLLTSPSFWTASGIDPERDLLCNAFLKRLDDKDFESAMDGLRNAVPLESFGDWVRSKEQREATKDELDDYRRQRLAAAFAPIAQALRGSAKAEYEALVAELGGEVRPRGDNAVWMGPTSPKSSSDLEQMEPAAVVAYLRDWKPTRGFREHSPEGLGRMLQPVVSANPDKYLDVTRQLSELHPVYLRNILAAFKPALRANAITRWESFIELIDLAVERTRSAFPSDFSALDLFDADQSWSGLRQTVALLIDDMLQSNSLPTRFSANIWRVLAILSQDPDPTAEADVRRAGMEPATAALNSVRGATMIAIVRFAMWAHQRHSAGDITEPEPWKPALDLLDEHLDPKVDCSPAVRSIYGEYLPWLQNIDERWVERNLSRIFPKESEYAELRRAAWLTYLEYCQIYSATYALLKDIYFEEVATLDKAAATERHEIAALENLSNHIWILYARGQSDLKEAGSLINVFLNNANEAVKEHMINSIGRTLNADTTINEDAMERLRALWSAMLNRLANLPESDQARILRPFGWWFSSLRLGETWSMEQLAEVLRRTGGKIEPAFQVVPRIADLSSRYPLEAVNLLLQIATSLEPFQMMNIQEHAGPILENALAAGGAAAEAATRVNTILSNQGIYTFRSLFDLQ